MGIAGNVHAEKGRGVAKVNHGELLTDTLLRPGDSCEGIGDDHDSVDVDKNGGDAKSRVIHGVEAGVGCGTFEAEEI
jgi:hypothetical protein